MNANRTLSLAIMSGKGGVGKTNVALNLGYALRDLGLRTLLMDCDLGLANLDVLLGISPDRNLQDLLRSDVDPSDVVLSLEGGGLDILPAASGVPELVEMDEDVQDVLFRKLVRLVSSYEVLMLDLGAGISNTVLSFASMAQMRIVIVTPEPTSLTDGYAMMKVLRAQHGVNDFCVVVNQTSSQAEAKQTFERLAMACKNFLGIEIVSLGSIRHDPNVVEAVRRQEPLLKIAPNAPASKDIQALADKVRRYRETNLERIAARPVMKQFPSF